MGWSSIFVVGQGASYLKSLGFGPLADSYEHGNEPSGAIKGGEFVDWLSDC